MTPTAMTPAARRAAAKRAADPEPATSHPRRLRRSAVPSAPRRVSGPSSRVVAPGEPSAPARPARPSPPVRPAGPASPSRPARSSSPARSSRTATGPDTAAAGSALRRAIPHPRRSSGPLTVRLAARVRTMPEHRLIDRLVRGQAWIPVLGVMLAGIVFMQVEVLKLGAGTGRAVQQASLLSSQNQQLRASVATLADDQRIESMAAQMGYIMPAPTAVGFLAPQANLAKALSAVAPPSATRFLAAASRNGSVALNNDLAATGGSNAGAITIGPAPGTPGSQPAGSTSTTPSSQPAGTTSTTPSSASTTSSPPPTAAPITGSATAPASAPQGSGG